MQEEGAIGLLAAIAGGFVALVVVTGIVLYAVDYEVNAEVKETRCELGHVKVETKIFGVDHTVKGVPANQCAVLEPGNFVEYRLRSQRTTLYDQEGGRCIYDSETGVNCGERRSDGGLFGLHG